MGIRQDWKRIEDWTAANFPAEFFRLVDGATEKQIQALERTLGVSLPDDVKESYRIHNGCSDTNMPYTGFLLPIDDIGKFWAACCQQQKEEKWGSPEYDDYQPQCIEGPIKPIWWNPLRIRVTDNCSGGGLTIDLDPPDEGTRGQVIHFDSAMGPTRVYAKGWGAFLKQVADDAEAGRFKFDEHRVWGRVD